MEKLLRFVRQNPQVALFLAICLVFGLGSFIVIIIALATAGSSNTNGEPSGAVFATVWMTPVGLQRARLRVARRRVP